MPFVPSSKNATSSWNQETSEVGKSLRAKSAVGNSGAVLCAEHMFMLRLHYRKCEVKDKGVRDKCNETRSKGTHVRTIGSKILRLLQLNMRILKNPTGTSADLTLFQLYCNLASNPIVNAASKRLSTRPDDLTQVLVF